MELNQEKNKSLEDTISMCRPLEDWFKRNQKIINYYDLNHFDRLQNEKNIRYGSDAIILTKMLNAVYQCIYLLPGNISLENKAIIASYRIRSIYNDNIDVMSDLVRERYYINIEQLEKDKVKTKSR